MFDDDSVHASAAQLPIEERLRLIDALSASVPDDAPPALSQEWLTEIEHRSEDLRTGLVKAEPWEEVRNRVFLKLGIERAD